MSQVTVDGVHVHYHMLGEGPDVLLIHGWVSSHRMWAHTQNRLAAAGYRATAIDLPGFGESAKPRTGWYTLDRFTLNLQGVCDKLKLSRPALVGHSLGGTLALSLALAQAAAALVAAAPVVNGELGLSMRVLLTSPATRRMIKWMQRQPFFVGLGDKRMLAVPGLMRDPIRRRNQEDLGKATVHAALGSLQALTGSLEDRLSEIRAPALIVIGGRDSTVPPAQGRLAARRIPGARMVEWHTAGHGLVDDRADEFDALLISHLRLAAAWQPSLDFDTRRSRLNHLRAI